MSDPAIGALYDMTRGATSSRSERTSAASCSDPNMVLFVCVGPPSIGELREQELIDRRAAGRPVLLADACRAR